MAMAPREGGGTRKAWKKLSNRLGWVAWLVIGQSSRRHRRIRPRSSMRSCRLGCEYGRPSEGRETLTRERAELTPPSLPLARRFWSDAATSSSSYVPPVSGFGFLAAELISCRGDSPVHSHLVGGALCWTQVSTSSRARGGRSCLEGPTDFPPASSSQRHPHLRVLLLRDRTFSFPPSRSVEIDSGQRLTMPSPVPTDPARLAALVRHRGARPPRRSDAWRTAQRDARKRCRVDRHHPRFNQVQPDDRPVVPRWIDPVEHASRARHVFLCRRTQVR